MDELTGLRVFIVEDEGTVALLLEDMLTELGCEVVGSVATLGKALEFATHEFFDVAVLDVNLDGHLVFPVAEILRRRQLPFLFSTGYGAIGIPDEFKSFEVLKKPFAIGDLKRRLVTALGRRPSASMEGA